MSVFDVERLAGDLRAKTARGRYTQAEAADQAGVSARTFNMIVADPENQKPKAETVDLLAKWLGRDIRTYIREPEAEEVA